MTRTPASATARARSTCAFPSDSLSIMLRRATSSAIDRHEDDSEMDLTWTICVRKADGRNDYDDRNQNTSDRCHHRLYLPCSRIVGIRITTFEGGACAPRDGLSVSAP